MSEFQVAPIDSRSTPQLEQVLKVFDEILGHGLFSPDSLAKLARNRESVLMGCWDEGALVGAATAVRLHASNANVYSPFGSQATALFEGQVVGSLRDSAVAAGHRRRGAGTALLQERVRWLRDVGCTVAVGFAWLHPGPDRSDTLLLKAGFHQVGPVVKDFYKSHGETVGLRCPFCGAPCRCSASMFAQRI